MPRLRLTSWVESQPLARGAILRGGLHSRSPRHGRLPIAQGGHRLENAPGLAHLPRFVPGVTSPATLTLDWGRLWGGPSPGRARLPSTHLQLTVHFQLRLPLPSSPSVRLGLCPPPRGPQERKIRRRQATAPAPTPAGDPRSSRLQGAPRVGGGPPASPSVHCAGTGRSGLQVSAGWGPVGRQRAMATPARVRGASPGAAPRCGP